MRLHVTSEGRDPLSFVPGEDLVVAAGLDHGAALPPGVLLDDHLTPELRRQVDARAHATLAAWSARADGPLTRHGVSLARIWSSELFAEVVLPAVRTRTALPAALAGAPAAALDCRGVGVTRATAAAATLAGTSWTTTGAAGEQEDPILAHFGRRPLTLRALPHRVIDALGLPGRVRGDVLVVAYGTTLPVLERLAESGPLRPAVHGAIPPAASLTLRVACRGGMTGRPGALARARSRRRTRALVDAVEALDAPLDVDGVDLGPAIARGAASYLRRRALETFAWAGGLRRALAGGSVRAVLLPFDWDPVGGTVAAVAADLGIPTLCLQHGYEPMKVYVPGGNSDLRGAWSAWDVEALPLALRGRTRVVGDTRREAGAAPARPAADGRGDAVVVLVQLDLRVSAVLDSRAPARHAAAAVAAARRVLPDAPILLRPHPSTDRGRAAALADRLGVGLDTTTPLRELLRTARVCVGATSSGTLECALSGTPVVMLDLERPGWTPPLDGSAGVPYATTVEELVGELRAVLDDPLRGHDDLLRGLGAGHPDPVGAVVGWLEELVGDA